MWHVDHAFGVIRLKVLWRYHSGICHIVVDKIGTYNPGKAEVCNLNRSRTQSLNCKAFATSVAVEIYENIQLALGYGIGAAAVTPVAR